MNREARWLQRNNSARWFYSSIPTGIKLIIKYFELKGMPVLFK
jgi:hypothetical protein